jgi:hypoxanthine-guanine phosphoribosyltransferase
MPELDDLPASYRDDVDEIVLDADAIDRRLRELAAQIDADYAGRELLLVGVLKGAIFVMADLSRHLEVPVGMDFMAVSSYGSGPPRRERCASSRTSTPTSRAATC